MFGGFNIISFSPWFVLFLVLFACFGRLDLFIVAYVVAILHEIGHLLAAKFFGYKIAGIKIAPFGVCLRLADNVSDSVHELLISLAGPFVNVILLASAAVLTYVNFSVPEVFFVSNFYMLFINFLPVMPLDGGRIIRAILKSEMSEKKAQKILKFISIPVVFILTVFGIVLLVKSKVNVSLLVASLFMCNSIKIHNNKSMDIASLYTSEITCDAMKVFYISANYTVKDALKELPFEDLCLVVVVSDDGKTKQILTNKYILGISGKGYLNYKISDI